MAFPHKFKKLLESKDNDVDRPDYLWLVYAVCGCEEDSCGWQGWIIDGVFKATCSNDTLLPSAATEDCPNCGKPLFRTEVELKFSPSEDQSGGLIRNVDYEVGEIEYREKETE
jgi:hypothetical protein